NVDLAEINWVIVGGEPGPGARAMAAEWVRDIRDQCKPQVLLSSSSSGVARLRSGPVAVWTIEPGMSCLPALTSDLLFHLAPPALLKASTRIRRSQTPSALISLSFKCGLINALSQQTLRDVRSLLLYSGECTWR